MERLQEQFNKQIAPALKAKYGFKNVMQVPRIQKIVLNVGVGKILKDSKTIDAIAEDVAKITGQAPVKTKARKSIAGFKVRENQIVGLTCTLRGFRMYSFLDKLCAIVLPRLRDFRGVPKKGLDKSGNYTLGMGEHTIFPEIDPAKSAAPHGMEITIVTSGDNREQSERLLTLLGLPFEK